MKKVVYYKWAGKYVIEIIDAAEDFGSGDGLPNESVWIIPGLACVNPSH